MHPYNQTTVAVFRPQTSTAHIVIAWIAAVMTGFILLPWAIAASRSKRNVVSIVLRPHQAAHWLFRVCACSGKGFRITMRSM